MASELEDRREQERQTWQFRAIAATQGNRSLLGTILLAVIGRNAKNPPWIEPPGATITPDGIVLVNFVDRHYMESINCPICDVEDLKNNFRGLADALKLEDKDRTAMFDELRKWIWKDFRLESDILKRS